MKRVPPEIEEQAPQGTTWFGGPVDRLKMSLRVHAKADERLEVSRLLGQEFDPQQKHWSISVPAATDGDLDAMISRLLSQLTADLSAWKQVGSRWEVDIFCGVFLERDNRGLELGVESMRLLVERGIALGFDIYSPEQLQA